MNRKRVLAAAKLLRPMASDLAAVRGRARWIGFVLLAGLSATAVRTYRIAVEEHEQYAERGHRQQIRAYKVAPSRGSILDRNGMALAVSDPIERVVINPRALLARRDGHEAVTKLEAILGADNRKALREALDHQDKAYRRIDVTLQPAQANAVKELRDDAIWLEAGEHRVYPRGHLASHLIGRVGHDGNGNLGMERALDDELAGRAAQSPAYFAAHPRGSKKLLVDGSPDPSAARGHTVVSTIDSAIQAMTEEELANLVASWHPVGASIIVLDPSTGEVLALANLPTFDSNKKVSNSSDTANLAVNMIYEPGSSLKAITVAAALEIGSIRPNQTFDCKNGVWQYTPQFAIHDTKRSGILDITSILAVSSNICTTQIYETLGKERLYQWIRRFHFGERPQIQLPGAARGLLADWRKWPDITAANISFGQGMAASPLQVAAAFSALANNGLFNHPTVVKRIVAANGSVVWEHEPARERVVRSDTARTVMHMLESVVHSKEGTGKNALIPGYRVAGKTSTAQKAGPHGGYLEGHYYSSFIGAVPALDPKVVILVSVDNPDGGHYGNQVAAPTFSRLGARLMAHLGVARQTDESNLPATLAVGLDDAPSESPPSLLADLDREPPLPGGRKLGATTGIPDFRGLTLAQALQEAQALRLDLVATGSGIAVEQDVEPGPVAAGTRVAVHFKPQHR
jgi:cell division protein FtsI (penicillin-binding protein 3)